MKVTVNSITGFEDAFATMYISKRSWNPEKDNQIRETVANYVDRNGKPDKDVKKEVKEEFERMLEMALRMGKKHITILRYIDISITVEGLHRGAQDDFDAHARRLDNRIIRSSTRLAEFGEEMSDWYKDNIITTDKACELNGIILPLEIERNGKKYIKAVNGYIREDLKDNKDVKRGLYMLSIPSNFITKCNLTEFSHIFKERNRDGGANPELKECVEEMVVQMNHWHPQITRELLLEIKN